MSASTAPPAVDAPAPAEARRPPGRAALAVLAALVVGFAGIDVLGDVTATRAESTRVFEQPVSAVRAVGTTGDVVVVASPGARGVELRTLVHEGWSSVRSSAEVVDGVLRLNGTCESGGWLSPCEVTWELTVPEGLDLDLRTGTGDQEVTGAFGTVVARAGTGDVRWDTASGASLEAETGTGDLDVRGRVAQVRARAGTGDVEVRLDAAPDAVDVTTGTGDAAVQVPAGSAYAVGVTAGFGEEVVEVPVDAASAHRIAVRTSTGDASVLPR
ncbi:DUF4097 family beta strand repeat-containing protein [Kineococcus esterisolvens]|uniref:DUF4097 family beta strand repeat-containing protein n=1 Tax=unclassified Kineococcus TaxID=2621656 RepID=UPI003D7E1CD4